MKALTYKDSDVALEVLDLLMDMSQLSASDVESILALRAFSEIDRQEAVNQSRILFGNLERWKASRDRVS